MRSNKLITLENGMSILEKAANESNLSVHELKILKTCMASLPICWMGGKRCITIEAAESFLENMNTAIKDSDYSCLFKERGLKVDRIVDIEEFVKSKDYMVQGNDVRPAIMRKLNEFWNPATYFIEAVLGGAIGIGKNYFSDMSIAYMLYMLSCYYNPQLEFGLAPGSSLVFIQQSKNERLARKVVFEQFSERLKLSPYFKQHFNFDRLVKAELRFPNNITVLPLGGSDTAALGMNVFGGCIDELNFMERVSDSVHTRFTGEEEYDQAERTYNTVIRRMKSRFMQKGKIPGRLLLISSTNYEGDFTDRKITESEKQLKDNGSTDIFVMKYSQWEALPEDRFSGEKFLVEVGSDVRRSRILQDTDNATDPEKVLHVPIEYKPEFVRDIDGALRDLGGVATGTRSPFIPFRELIVEATELFNSMTNGISLFKKDTAFLSMNGPEFGADRIWSDLVNERYIDEALINPDQAFAAHIDVGLSREKGDAAGLAIGHISGYKELPAYKYFNPHKKIFIEVTDIRAPIYVIDGILQVRAKHGDEIDLLLVQDLVMWLKGKINVKWGTMDTYQSVMMIQAFKKAKIRAGNLSVDTDIAPYAELKAAIKDKRILYPNNQIFLKEVREVEKIPDKDRIDHPKEGSKDCSDAVAGVCFMLQRKEADFRGKRKGRSMEENGMAEKAVRKIRFKQGNIRRKFGRVLA